MNKKTTPIIVLLICFLLFTTSFTGCIEEDKESEDTEAFSLEETQQDTASILPDWKDDEYHDYYGTTSILNDFNNNYPDLVDVFSIGNSILGRDIWCIRITNEKNNEEKYSCLIDGCIHGVEWEGGEACLYLAEYLLINFDTNKTIIDILNNTEIYLIPLVNPDGRQNDEVGNDNGVDLNRNFDVYFGKLRSRVYRFRKLFGKIKIDHIKTRPNDPSKWWRNCGRYAFSEPESQALRDFMTSLNFYDFSFYVNCHTAMHNIITPTPWSKSILNPPYIMTENEIRLFDYVKDWIEENTEYEADRYEENMIGGCADIWAYNEFGIPSFTFEILSIDYDAWYGEQKHDNLVHWMKTTIPVFMYLLVNIENLNNWETPDIEPLLPEGVPPIPLS
ncbi:MAG: hypothetical protein JSW62_01810 [Thermoplasmatales archaeon]|nr:MAG: hypothetical protein JSW62_01810 [Thermoplasmatales archaeon]